jgi:hypothetical protein
MFGAQELVTVLCVTIDCISQMQHCLLLQPEETEFAPLAQYCNSIGMAVAMVPEGFDLTPPQINSDDEDEDEYVGFKPIVEDKSEKNASNNSMNSSVDDGDAWQ